jgi:ribosomal protein S18 acetylase RimI-like enzyme
VTLSSRTENRGIGAALLEECFRTARDAGCTRLFLTTTNDNLRALGFYQRRGWRIVAVYPGAMDAARLITPTIPRTAPNGIPIRDEIELERRLDTPVQP